MAKNNIRTSKNVARKASRLMKSKNKNVRSLAGATLVNRKP